MYAIVCMFHFFFLNKMNNIIKTTTLTIGVVAMLQSCNVSNKADGWARFDNFTYQGADDFYRDHPLPNENSFYNPILPGWYSDPSICTNGKGDYFLATSTFVYFPGVPLFHSRDLVNWTQIGHVLNRESQLQNLQSQHVSGGIFAPALAYNPHNETYYMITTNVGAGNFFVKTKDPFSSEWSDPVYLPEVTGIDPSFFFDEDGSAYIVNNDEPTYPAEYDGHRSIRIQRFDVEKECTFGPRPALIDKGCRPEEKPIWIEGPHMYKINGKYYLMDAEGGTSVNHSEVIFTADSPMGPFIPWKNNPILTQRHLDPQRPNPITCAGHADLIQAAEGDWWAVFLACRPIDGGFGYENLGRETFIMPVRWTSDGYPIITEGDEIVSMICERKGVKVESNARLGNFCYTDSFTTPTLAPDWLSLRGAATDKYQLSGGQLSLKCDMARATERCTPAMLTRVLHHHKFVCTTDLTFSPKDTEEAGLILFKDERHHYYLTLSQCADQKVVKLHQVNGSDDVVVASEKVTNGQDTIKLRIISDGATFTFTFSVDGDKWTQVGNPLEARPLSTANAGGFTGTTIGLYAIK